jgi:hypothetical protein
MQPCHYSLQFPCLPLYSPLKTIYTKPLLIWIEI